VILAAFDERWRYSDQRAGSKLGRKKNIIHRVTRLRYVSSVRLFIMLVSVIQYTQKISPGEKFRHAFSLAKIFFCPVLKIA
jgi:hypothetical protein